MDDAKKHYQSFTVGKLDAGMILIGERAHLIEFPSLLLPPGTQSGSIVSISVQRDLPAEHSHQKAFTQLQSLILSTYGQTSPSPPQLILRNTTQTSVTLEWGKLELATAQLKGVDIYRNGTRLAGIPNPTFNTSTKLSSLALDTDYTFQLVMKTSAGTFPSNVIRARTHTINDTSGISVSFGNVQDPNLLNQCKAALDQMGAKYSDHIQIDTTHFVCTTPVGSNGGSGPSVEYQKALQLSLPVVEPGWILACLSEKRMVPISQHLLGTHTTTFNPTAFNRSSLPSSPFTNRASLPTDTDAEAARNTEDEAAPAPAPAPTMSVHPDESEEGAESGLGLAPDQSDAAGIDGSDERQEFKRPASRNGGVLNRAFKFPLSENTGSSTSLPLDSQPASSSTDQPDIKQAAAPLPPKEDARLPSHEDERPSHAPTANTGIENREEVETEFESVTLEASQSNPEPRPESETETKTKTEAEPSVPAEEPVATQDSVNHVPQTETEPEVETKSEPTAPVAVAEPASVTEPEPVSLPTSVEQLSSETQDPTDVEEPQEIDDVVGNGESTDDALREEGKEEKEEERLTLPLRSPSIMIQDMDSDLPASPLVDEDDAGFVDVDVGADADEDKPVDKDDEENGNEEDGEGGESEGESEATEEGAAPVQETAGGKKKKKNKKGKGKGKGGR